MLPISKFYTSMPRLVFLWQSVSKLFKGPFVIQTCYYYDIQYVDLRQSEHSHGHGMAAKCCNLAAFTYGTYGWNPGWNTTGPGFKTGTRHMNSLLPSTFCHSFFQLSQKNTYGVRVNRRYGGPLTQLVRRLVVYKYTKINISLPFSKTSLNTSGKAGEQ